MKITIDNDRIKHLKLMIELALDTWQFDGDEFYYECRDVLRDIQKQLKKEITN